MDKKTGYLVFLLILCTGIGIYLSWGLTREHYTHQQPTFYFDRDDEVNRFYYEGYIQFRTDDNSFRLVFENPEYLEVVENGSNR